VTPASLAPTNATFKAAKRPRNAAVKKQASTAAVEGAAGWRYYWATVASAVDGELLAQCVCPLKSKRAHALNRLLLTEGVLNASEHVQEEMVAKRRGDDVREIVIHQRVRG
jgi:hypothetical protein